MGLPSTPADVTPAWLTSVLPAATRHHRDIVGVSWSDIGEGTGIFGQIARMTLTLDDASSLSVIVKMPCLEPANLAVAQALGLYEREIAMFRNVVTQSPLTAVTCLAAPTVADGSFVLILEDLADRWNVGDQVVGATLAQAQSTIDALAAFHAHWWQHPDLDTMTWLPTQDAPQYVAVVPVIYRAGLSVLQDQWANRLPGAALEVATRLGPRFEEIIVRTAQGPNTVIHGDTRLDNVFFARDGSGAVAFIDFQLSLRARGVGDIAYMISNSVPQDVARQHWQGLLQRWLDGLAHHGVHYDADQALLHYREAVLYYLSGAMSLVGTFDAGNERGAAMIDAYVTRSLNHVVDCDAGSVL